VTPPRFGDRRAVRVGLLGGSFNPAHGGHRHVAAVARRRLRLDQVWLLVSPGNPLKPAAGMAKLAERLASARALADGRRVIATDWEARAGTRYTADTVALLRRRFPRARLVFIAGADNLAGLHRWDRWQRLARAVPFAFVPRPGHRAAVHGRAACVLRQARRPDRQAAILPLQPAPAWVFVPCRTSPLSATAIRAAQGETPIARTPTADPAAAAPPKPRARRSRAAEGQPADAPPRPRRAATKAAVADGPSPSPRRRRAPEPPALDRLTSLITTSLEDDKAEDVRTLDLAGRASFADRMVIATGLADRQITAMATHLLEKLKAAGVRGAHAEGLGKSDWVLIDAGDIVVHLFRPDARAAYALEKMWGPESPAEDAATG
jgi:nicotinate-nucleotide adenylyltransferase